MDLKGNPIEENAEKGGKFDNILIFVFNYCYYFWLVSWGVKMFQEMYLMACLPGCDF